MVITLDFLGEIYSSAAKNLDFMRVCESVVMNIGTMPEQSLRCSGLFFVENKKAVAAGSPPDFSARRPPFFAFYGFPLRDTSERYFRSLKYKKAIHPFMSCLVC